MCIFCQIVKKEIPSDFLFEDESLIAIKDIKPSAPVHILIVPKKHIESVNEIEETDVELIGRMIYRAKILAGEQGVADSGFKLIFNCGDDGGQVIGHLHLHLLGGKKLSSVV